VGLNNAYLLVPSWNCPINIEQVTSPIRLPAAARWVRFSLVTTQPMRDKPRFGARLQIRWTNVFGMQPIYRDPWESPPKDAWTEDEIAQGLPVSGHPVGSPPGIVPHDVGPFAYEVEQAPAVNQVDLQKLPSGYDLAFVSYTILGGNNGSPVNVAVVVEALAADGSPLEFS